uniref:MBOAT family O-acyltransferase n=1 Tax=Lachnospira sp. TaxID=2049031 RepID=UPI003FF0F844
MCYSLQLYYDFSGYSDMAIGIGKIFGFNCKQNFNYPYMTKSISEFWRRWHISLGSWFKDYVYFPLGGSRVKSKMKLYFNLLVVWLLTGIWNGANWNFILWGFIFFIFIALEKTFNIPQKLNKLGSVLYRIFCLFIINIQWVLFNSSTIKNAFKYILRMFSKKGDVIYNHRASVLLSEYWMFILIAIIFSMPVLPWINNLKKKSKILEIIIDLLMVLIIVLCFIWAVTFIITGQNNPFMYANF